MKRRGVEPGCEAGCRSVEFGGGSAKSGAAAEVLAAESIGLARVLEVVAA
ncbi:hypothetical protein [Lentzea nigeriaca]|nr:hypothetical protein [Lentzea nigeriaca]MBM7856704.1 hypothetical protein [Lentzea nigeriaca]